MCRHTLSLSRETLMTRPFRAGAYEFSTHLPSVNRSTALTLRTTRQYKQARKDSNLQPTVLETVALPIAPLTYLAFPLGTMLIVAIRYFSAHTILDFWAFLQGASRR